MLQAEKKLVRWADQNKLWLFAAAITIIALGIRRFGLPMVSPDFRNFLKPWYDVIEDGGGLAALSYQVGDYNVVYQFLIALMTYLPISVLHAYKGLSILFDLLLAFGMGRLAYLCSGKDKCRAIAAYSITLLLPSIFINSAYWAQCDSIYCFFLVLWLTDMLEEKYTRAFLFLAIAFQFKLQTIFVLPFLLYFYVRTEKISIWQFLIVPAMSVVLSLLCGRGPFGTFTIYASQTGTWEYMFAGFPSIWILIAEDYALFRNAATLLTIGILGVGMLLVLEKKTVFNRQNIFNLLIWSIWTCLLFLPAMHDRYGYFLTLLLLTAAVLNVRMAGYAALVEVVTCISYNWCLWPDSIAASIPSYLVSMLYAAGYALFTYRSFVQKKDWFPREAAVPAEADADAAG